jgi:uncharacterized damage-inducible protein DinB
MNSQAIEQITTHGGQMSYRSEALAARIEAGAKALASFVATLSEAEWQTPIHRDGRKIGAVVYHVANIYPVEIRLASLLAAGQPITGVTWESINRMNRNHAKENDRATKQDTLALLAENSAAAARAIRAFTDEELDRAAPVSLNSDARITSQSMLEDLDHTVRHSYHHLAQIRAALALQLRTILPRSDSVSPAGPSGHPVGRTGPE